jgi:hypothetical protein
MAHEIRAHCRLQFVESVSALRSRRLDALIPL